MERVVVTGASGFLGRALLQRLACEDIDVVPVSRQEGPGYIRVDSYAETPEGDTLIHLAEANDRQWVNSRGKAYVDYTFEVTKSLLKKNFRYVIYGSSAVLYGDKSLTARSEDDPIHVVDSYTEIKHLSEQEILKNAGSVARLTNIYGQGMARTNVLTAITDQLYKTGPISLHSLSPVRDFLWISDAVEALAQMIVKKTSGVFNVGTGVGISIAELAKLILEIAGQENRQIAQVQPACEISNLVLDISKISSRLKWSPKTDIESGLRLLISNFQTRV